MPDGGEVVPCHRHGYCAVAATGQARDLSPGASRRAAPRSQRELLEWLRSHPVTTVSVARRQRFTLRMLFAARDAGLLEIDKATGSVLLRSP